MTELDSYWAADISYVWTEEAWPYLAEVLDLFSLRVVGWSTGSRLNRSLVIDAVRMDIFDYLERVYDTERPHSSLGHAEPVELEKRRAGRKAAAWP